MRVLLLAAATLPAVAFSQQGGDQAMNRCAESVQRGSPEAEAWCRFVVERIPHIWEAHALYAGALGISGKLKESAAEFALAVQLAPPAQKAGIEMLKLSTQTMGKIPNTTLGLGYWLDPTTQRIWTSSDNGATLNWKAALEYCSGLRIGDWADWRLPEIEELRELYDPGIQTLGTFIGQTVQWHVRGGIHLTGGHWSATQSAEGEALVFFFSDAVRDATQQRFVSFRGRALCVRP